MIFLIINWPNFVYWFIQDFTPPPLNFYEASRFVLHRMDVPERHNGQRDASVCPSVRSFVRLLDGV